MQTYIQGEDWYLSYLLLDENDLAADADTLQVRLRKMNGSEWTYVLGSDAEVSQTGSGVYRFEDNTLTAGTYDIEFQADGTTADRVRRQFRLKAAL